MPTSTLLSQENYLQQLSQYNFTPQNKAKTKMRCAIIHAADLSTIASSVLAQQFNIADISLIGPEAQIRAIAAKNDLNLANCEIIDSNSPNTSAKIAIQMVQNKHANIIAKGKIGTAAMMRCILKKENNLRSKRRISHIFLMTSPSYHKPFILTDAAINTQPDLSIKEHIIHNAIYAFDRLYNTAPKVAILSASELVNESMPSSIDAAILAKTFERNHVNTRCIIDGPLAFDNAFSIQAAQMKNIQSPVAGDADIFVAPNIDAGNIAYKQMRYMGEATGLGIVMGAKIPIILTSRAEDDVMSRLLSYDLASRLA